LQVLLGKFEFFEIRGASLRPRTSDLDLACEKTKFIVYICGLCSVPVLLYVAYYVVYVASVLCALCFVLSVCSFRLVPVPAILYTAAHYPDN
jgi:hypothetical protein